MALWGLGIGAVAGLAKSELVDQPREDRQRKLQSQMQRWSPWTGNSGKDPQLADPIGATAGLGAAGAQVGQGIKNDQANDALKKSLASDLSPTGNGSYAQSVESWKSNPYSSPSAAAADPVGATNVASGMSQAKDYPGALTGQQKTPAWFYGNGPSPYAQPMGPATNPWSYGGNGWTY